MTFEFFTPLTTQSRQWRVKVTQIPCGTPSTPPQFCLQYFTGVSGTISSYNFDVSSVVVVIRMFVVLSTILPGKMNE